MPLLVALLPRRPGWANCEHRAAPLRQLRGVNGGKMARCAVLEENEPPIATSVQLAEHREIELGIICRGWIRVLGGSGGFGAAIRVGGRRPRIAGNRIWLGVPTRHSGRRRIGSRSRLWTHYQRGRWAFAQRGGLICDGSRCEILALVESQVANGLGCNATTAQRWFGVEVSTLVDNNPHATVAAPRREIVITCIRRWRIFRFRHGRLLEQIRTPARSFELVGFPKAGKPFAERAILAPAAKRCLSLHHDQMWFPTPS